MLIVKIETIEDSGYDGPAYIDARIFAAPSIGAALDAYAPRPCNDYRVSLIGEAEVVPSS